MGVIEKFGVCVYIFINIVIFINIWKGDKQKNCPRYFQIRKYAFLNI